MPIFAYEAANTAGKTQKGTIEAGTSEEAVRKIRTQGLFPTSVREQKEAAKKAAESKKKKKKSKGMTISLGGVSTKALTLFTRQMSTLQDAGLPLLRSLQILEDQQKPGKLKNVLGDVCESIGGGSSLSEAFAHHPRVFTTLYVKMVAAGEIGGVLDVVMQRLSEFMEKAQRLKRRIIGAMIYPAVVITIAVAIVTGIMYFVIPKFQEIFADFDVALPGLTVWLIGASKWVAGQQPDQKVPGAIWIIASPFLIFSSSSWFV